MVSPCLSLSLRYTSTQTSPNLPLCHRKTNSPSSYHPTHTTVTIWSFPGVANPHNTHLPTRLMFITTSLLMTQKSNDLRVTHRSIGFKIQPSCRHPPLLVQKAGCHPSPSQHLSSISLHISAWQDKCVPVCDSMYGQPAQRDSRKHST